MQGEGGNNAGGGVGIWSHFPLTKEDGVKNEAAVIKNKEQV